MFFCLPCDQSDPCWETGAHPRPLRQFPLVSRTRLCYNESEKTDGAAVGEAGVER